MDVPDEAGARERVDAFVRAAGFDPAQIADRFAFGATADQMDELADLVVAGPKRATTALLRWYEVAGERLPIAGDLVVILAGSNRPCAIARVTRVECKPFRAIDAADAWDEGEGDRSLEYWRAAHLAFFSDEAAEGGFTFTDDDPVVFCRFALLWPPATPIEHEAGEPLS